MFSLRDYIKKGFLDAVGKMSNYQIILNSAGWMEKGVLTEEDLTEINAAIEAWETEQIIETVEPSEETIPVEDVVTEETTEDVTEESTETVTEEVTKETVEDTTEDENVEETAEEPVEASTEETT